MEIYRHVHADQQSYIECETLLFYLIFVSCYSFQALWFGSWISVIITFAGSYSVRSHRTTNSLRTPNAL